MRKGQAGGGRPVVGADLLGGEERGVAGRGDHLHPLAGVGDEGVRGGQHGRLAGAGGALDEHHGVGAGDRPHPVDLTPVQARVVNDRGDIGQRCENALEGAADGEAALDVPLQVEHFLRRQVPHMRRHRLVHDGQAAGLGAAGDVLGQIPQHRPVGDHVAAGEDLLGDAAHVEVVPGRPAAGTGGQHPHDAGSDLVPVHLTGPHRRQLHRAGGPAGVDVDPQPAQLGQPGVLALLTAGGVVLLRFPFVGPRPLIPRPAQLGSGFLPGVVLAPLLLVAGDVLGDLLAAFAHRRHHRGELVDLPRRQVQGVAVGGQRGPELRVGGHRPVADPVDRPLHPQHRRRVDPPPLPGRRHPRVQL